MVQINDPESSGLKVCCQVASVVSDSVQPHGLQPTRLLCPWDSPGKHTGVGCHFLLQCMKVESEREVTQLCPTLSDPMDYSLPGSSIHGIFQARVLEWGAIAFSIYLLPPQLASVFFAMIGKNVLIIYCCFLTKLKNHYVYSPLEKIAEEHQYRGWHPSWYGQEKIVYRSELVPGRVEGPTCACSSVFKAICSSVSGPGLLDLSSSYHW